MIKLRLNYKFLLIIFTDIPYFSADTDDTSINLSIGTSLERLQDYYPSAYSAWKESNIGSNSMVEVTKSLLKYSYKPFLNNSNSNTIDPRTYYWIQEYLLTLDSSQKNSEISFITTWLLDINKNRQTYYHDYAMPFNVNNVDASVIANTIQGFTRTILFDPFNSSLWFDNEVQNLYKNSVDLISWVIHQRLLDERPDLVLLYYMGNFNFYWFVSRTVYLLNSYANEETLPYSVLQYTLDTLENAMRTNGTQAILGGGMLVLFYHSVF